MVYFGIQKGNPKKGTTEGPLGIHLSGEMSTMRVLRLTQTSTLSSKI